MSAGLPPFLTEAAVAVHFEFDDHMIILIPSPYWGPSLAANYHESLGLAPVLRRSYINTVPSTIELTSLASRQAGIVISEHSNLGSKNRIFRKREERKDKR
ncbi:hypothetical protein TWF569_001468 [Orbilia oligospora]|nr:hypothetical protein TWF569_001468 [Orbilia oligospora]